MDDSTVKTTGVMPYTFSIELKDISACNTRPTSAQNPKGLMTICCTKNRAVYDFEGEKKMYVHVRDTKIATTRDA